MKKLFFALFILVTINLTAQDGAEHCISKVLPGNEVEINIGRQFNVKPNDVFQVFGKGQVIHPATGKLIERDNVFIGKIKIIKVNELTSVAEIVDSKKLFAVGNKIVKVTSADQEVVEHKRPVQAEFERPRERNYSETIYTQKGKKGKVDKVMHITEINQSGGQLSAITDKGSESKVKGSVPGIGKKYFLYIPTIDTSVLTGQKRISGEEYIGKLTIKSVDHDASSGSLILNKERNLGFIEKNNRLQQYVPKSRGWQHCLRLNIGELLDYDEEVLLFNGIEVINGYRIAPFYFMGIGLGYNTAYHKGYRDALICNLPLFLNQRFYFFSGKKHSICLNSSLGKNVVLNSNHSVRPYEIHGKLFFSGGFGFRRYIGDYGAFLVDVDIEYKSYEFINYAISYPNDELLLVTLKLGFELNYSPFNK